MLASELFSKEWSSFSDDVHAISVETTELFFCIENNVRPPNGIAFIVMGFIAMVTVETLFKPTVLSAGDKTACANAEVPPVVDDETEFPFAGNPSISCMGDNTTYKHNYEVETNG